MYLIPSNNEKLMSEREKIKTYYATDFIKNGADFDQEPMDEILDIRVKTK